MSNGSDGRSVGRAGSGFRRCVEVAAVAAVFLTAGPPARLSAQVGYAPSRSPFRDITTKQSLTFMAGYFLGNKGRAHVGAQAGPMVGVRFRTSLSGPIDLSGNFSFVQSQRYTINTFLPADVRMEGPIDYDLIFADLSLGLTLTGTKTWHGLAPYIGMGMGLTAPTKTVVDPGGYKAGSGFTIVPMLGVRAYLSRHLGLQFEARDNTIRYEYPLAYFNPRDLQGNAISPPVLQNTTDKQTTHNLTVSVGLSYHFVF